MFIPFTVIVSYGDGNDLQSLGFLERRAQVSPRLHCDFVLEKGVDLFPWIALLAEALSLFF